MYLILIICNSSTIIVPKSTKYKWVIMHDLILLLCFKGRQENLTTVLFNISFVQYPKTDLSKAITYLT